MALTSWGLSSSLQLSSFLQSAAERRTKLLDWQVSCTTLMTRPFHVARTSCTPRASSSFSISPISSWQPNATMVADCDRPDLDTSRRARRASTRKSPTDFFVWVSSWPLKVLSQSQMKQSTDPYFSENSATKSHASAGVRSEGSACLVLLQRTITADLCNLSSRCWHPNRQEDSHAELQPDEVERASSRSCSILELQLNLSEVIESLSSARAIVTLSFHDRFSSTLHERKTSFSPALVTTTNSLLTLPSCTPRSS
mmetsp:Transcript_7575/g.17215  ORF Transcript_7575/g.17215 Transcript_7575/m.17215 type:complete len:255 (+) Transcript_7575:556-1320(+)